MRHFLIFGWSEDLCVWACRHNDILTPCLWKKWWLVDHRNLRAKGDPVQMGHFWFGVRGLKTRSENSRLILLTIQHIHTNILLHIAEHCVLLGRKSALCCEHKHTNTHTYTLMPPVSDVDVKIMVCTLKEKSFYYFCPMYFSRTLFVINSFFLPMGVENTKEVSFYKEKRTKN